MTLTTKKKVGEPTAIDILMADHAKVKKLFKKYEKLVKSEASDTEKKEVATLICQELTVHATLEEELFYPKARKAIDEDDLLDEAEVEHSSAKDLIAQIESMEPDDDLYDAKVTVLGEYINHHVEEEEKQMFPKVKKAKLNLEQMAKEILSRKEVLMAEATATTPIEKIALTAKKKFS